MLYTAASLVVYGLDSTTKVLTGLEFLECTLTKQLIAARLSLSPFSPLRDRIGRIVWSVVYAGTRWVRFMRVRLPLGGRDIGGYLTTRKKAMN